MEDFHSINQEMIKTIKHHQTKLNEEYNKLNEKIEKYIISIKDKPFNCMNETDTNVNQLRESIIGVKLLQECFGNYKSFDSPKINYSDKLSDLESQDLTDETLNIILPMAAMLHTIFSLKKL